MILVFILKVRLGKRPSILSHTGERFRSPTIPATPYTATPITQPIAIEMSQNEGRIALAI